MSISDFSLSRHTLRFLIVRRYGHQPMTMRSPKFVYIPSVNIPSLLTPATPHTPDCLAISYAISVCSSRFRPIRGTHQSHFRLTKPVCSRIGITVCLLATRELKHKPHDLCPPTKHFCSFHYRPNSQLTGWIFTNWYINASWRTEFHEFPKIFNTEFKKR